MARAPALLLACCLAAWSEPAAADAAATEPVWLAITAPEEGLRHRGPLGWVEVRGWAGSGRQRGHDVVVVVDVSASTLLPAGGRAREAEEAAGRWDDTETGRAQRSAVYAEGDSIVRAEVSATLRLLGLLDPELSRVGVVAFADEARLVSPLAPPTAALAAACEPLMEVVGGDTNVAAGLEMALDELAATGRPGAARSIVVLTDGYPNLPGGEEPATDAVVERANAAAAAGVRIHSFGLGLRRRFAFSPYRRAANLTDGRYERLDSAGELLERLPRIDFARLAAVDVLNTTTGASGQAVRLYPDGSFDGLLELAPGENRIRITARGRDGQLRSHDRLVYFEPRRARTRAEREELEEERERIRDEIALRSVEGRLTAEMIAARQLRRLVLSGEESP